MSQLLFLLLHALEASLQSAQAPCGDRRQGMAVPTLLARCSFHHTLCMAREGSLKASSSHGWVLPAAVGALG